MAVRRCEKTGPIAGIANAAPVVFPKYGLTSDLPIAHAMAQFSHECGAGNELEENLNYSEQGLINTWPTRFNPGNTGAFARQPQKIANQVMTAEWVTFRLAMMAGTFTDAAAAR